VSGRKKVGGNLETNFRLDPPGAAQLFAPHMVKGCERRRLLARILSHVIFRVANLEKLASTLLHLNPFRTLTNFVTFPSQCRAPRSGFWISSIVRPWSFFSSYPFIPVLFLSKLDFCFFPYSFLPLSVYIKPEVAVAVAVPIEHISEMSNQIL